MPQASNIVLKNGAATPVDTTFAVEQATPALSSFVDRSPGVAAGFSRIRLSNTFASGSKSTVNRATMSIDLPVLGMVNGVASVAYVVRAKLELIIPEQSTATDRANLYAFVKNALGHSAVTASLRDLDPQY